MIKRECNQHVETAIIFDQGTKITTHKAGRGERKNERQRAVAVPLGRSSISALPGYICGSRRKAEP